VIRPVGRLGDGTAVMAVALGHGDGLQAEVLTYGGILRRLTLPTATGRRDLVLGLPDPAAYEADPAFLGCLIGRTTNRIAGARFALAGRPYRLVANDGANHLHGGRRGFGKRMWRVQAAEAGPVPRLILARHAGAGEEGYPGGVEIQVTIELTAAALSIRFEATADATTPFDMTWHPYFNLSGDPHRPVARHELTVAADAFLPVDAGQIPDGPPQSVVDTPFDLRRPTPLGAVLGQAHPQIRSAGGLDHCYVLTGRGPAARLRCPDSGIGLQVTTDQPALQVYTGQGLATHPDRPGSGICLEPQGFPDAVNRPDFPDTVLRPGQRYRRRIRYVFDADGV